MDTHVSSWQKRGNVSPACGSYTNSFLFWCGVFMRSLSLGPCWAGYSLRWIYRSCIAEDPATQFVVRWSDGWNARFGVEPLPAFTDALVFRVNGSYLELDFSWVISLRLRERL